MRSDVHSAALKAAAKVAFSVALLNGCSNADVAESSDGTATDESAVSKAPPCHEPKSCAEILSSTFPTPGRYQWEPVAQSAEVVACCNKELDGHGAATKYRWDCCVAYNPATVPDGGQPQPGGWSSGHGAACTPWGPPVPPSMDRLAKKRAKRVRRSPVARGSELALVA